MIAAVVPVKSLAAAKSRLVPRLGRAAADRLALAMLGDLLDVLRATQGLARIAVATPDAEVAEAARAAGAEVLLRDDPGLNAAVEAAGAELAPGRDDGLLVVLGDVAGADPRELEQLIAALGGPGVALAPSADGGSSALLRVPRDAIPAGFGPGSAKVHRDLATRAGVAYRELALPSLAIDVDLPEDLEALRRSGRAGPRTSRLLDALAPGTAGPGGSPDELRAVALRGIPAVHAGDDLARLLQDAARRAGLPLSAGVLVVCQKIVSKAEGRVVALAQVEPSAEAVRIAREDEKDPRHVEVVLREAKRIVRRGPGVLICETRHGFVCANAGVDLSNAPGDDVAVLLPVDPDASAARLRDALQAAGCGPLAVVVSDTFGRPWREGLVDVAIGCAGIAPIEDLRGRPDLGGRELQVTAMATADQLAAAAGILMTKDAGVPAVWIEGLAPLGDGGVRALLRDPAKDLFR